MDVLQPTFPAEPTAAAPDTPPPNSAAAAGLVTQRNVTQRNWQDQPLPAPLISYEQAELVALSLLRRRPDSRALVGLSEHLVLDTLADAGVAGSWLLMGGREQLRPDLVLRTNGEGADRFDALHAQVLAGPQSPPDPEATTWLRQRRLAHLRSLALGGRESRLFLPALDAAWLTDIVRQQPAQPADRPALGRWLLQAVPLLLAGGLATLAYIYNAGSDPALGLLFVLPLLGALGFGAYLFFRLTRYRNRVAVEWLARPARLRPDSTAVARALARKPWWLLVLPVLLMAAAFLVLVGLLVSSALTTVPSMVVPFVLSQLLLLLLTYLIGRRYLTRTQELVQQLPVALLPEQQPLWHSFLFY